MVLENWVRGKLHELLGHYIEIDRDALKLAIWNGHLVLNNLRLLPGPIPGSPFCVASGSLRRLELTVPWKNLKRKPVIVHIDELEVIYSPRGAITPEERRSEAARALERKRELLRSLDGDGEPGTDDGRAATEDDFDMDDDAEHSSFLERLSGQIMRNIEIKIDNVRMVYRDSISLPTYPFELVARIGSLGIQSCDASWFPAVVAEDDGELLFRKLVTLSDMSISFECGGRREELLRPLTAELKMENYAQGEPSRPVGGAQNTLSFDLDRVELQFSRMALVCCVAVAQKSDLSAYLAYVQYRPAARPCKGTARDWWQYARRGVTYSPETRNKVQAQKRWADLSWQVSARAEYLRLYKASRRRPITGLNVQPTPMSAEDRATLNTLDERFDTRAVALFRRVAMAEVRVERATTKQALRSYKRVKEDSMGSSLNRMKMKATMSKTEYTALKPFKPTDMMEITQEQRRAIFEELGVGKETERRGGDASQTDQMDIRITIGTSAIVLKEDAVHADAHQLQPQLVFRIGATSARLRIRSASQRLECQVASIILYDETNQRNGESDAASWHDGKALSIQPDAKSEYAVTILIDTAGTGGHGEVDCSIGPVSLVYSRPAHVFLLGTVDEFSSQSLDHESYGFVSKAKSRVGRFSDRAKRQLKSRLHRTHSKRITVSIATISMTLPLHVTDETSPAIRITVQELSARTKEHGQACANAPTNQSNPDKLARPVSASQDLLDADLFDQLYLRVDVGCKRLHTSMLDERCGRELEVVPTCRLEVEIAVMLVNEIQIDGESLTAGLPWYEVAVDVDGFDIRLTADQLPVATAIMQAVHNRPAVSKPANNICVSGSDTLWPMHTRLKLSLGHVSAEIQTEEAVIEAQVDNFNMEYTLDCGQQSWITADVSSLVVCCQSDRGELQNLLTTEAGSESAISATLTSTYGSRTDLCDVSLVVTVRSTIAVGIPRAFAMQPLVPRLREINELIDLPPSPVIVSPKQTQVPHGTRTLEASIHRVKVTLPLEESPGRHLLELTANSVMITQNSFERAVLHQCTCADIIIHTDMELECSMNDQPNTLVRCGHCGEVGPGLSLEVKSSFSEERGQFAVQNVSFCLSGACFTASTAVQVRALEYISNWHDVLGIDRAGERATAAATQASDAAAALVREAKAQRLERLHQHEPPVETLTLEPSELDTPGGFADTANINVQIDSVQLVVPSTQRGEGIKLDIGTVRISKATSIKPQTNVELLAVQIGLLRSSSGGALNESPVLRQTVSVALTVSTSPAKPEIRDCSSSILDQGLIDCNISAIECDLSKNALAIFGGAVETVRQSTALMQILREKKVEWCVGVTCSLVSLGYLSDHIEEFLSVDIVDIQAKAGVNEVMVQAGGLCVACVVDGRTVDFIRLEKLETTDTYSVAVNFCRCDARQLSVQLGDLQLMLSPEVARALLVPRDRSSTAEDSFAIRFSHTPRDSDFILTEDDIILCDMTLSANERLFVTGQPGQILKLQGNGHSLRFEGEGTSLLVLISPGTTLLLDDMVLENWNHERVELGPGSKIIGVVEIADKRTMPALQSPRLVPAGIMSKMRSISRPTGNPIEKPKSSTPKHETSTPLGGGLLVPVTIAVASCCIRFVVPSPGSDRPKATGKSSRRIVHQRASSEDIGRMTRVHTLRPRNCSADAGGRHHRRTPSLDSNRSYSVDVFARLTFCFTPTAHDEPPTARLVVDEFCSSVSTIIEGRAFTSTKLNEPLTVVLQIDVEESHLGCELEILDGIAVQVTSDTVSRIGYVLLCARDAWEEVGIHRVPGSAVAVGRLKEYQLSLRSLTISSFIVELVDPSGVSFLRCTLLNFFSQASYTYDSQRVFLRTDVSADYYNGTVSAWEPFVEQWHVFAVSKYTDDPDIDRSELDFNIRSSNGISVNITRHLLAVYSRVLMPWAKSIQVRNPDALRLMPPDASFTIRNDTRQQVCIWLPTSDGVTVYDLAPSENIEYDGSCLIEHGSKTAKRVRIDCEGCSGNIALQRVGVSHLLLESPDKSCHVHIGVHVMQMQETAKHVFIRSEAFIQNQTAISLALKLGQDTDSLVVQIEPFSHVTCPLHDFMAIAPCNGTGRATHEWVRLCDTQSDNGVVNSRVQLISCAPLSMCDNAEMLLKRKLSTDTEPEPEPEPELEPEPKSETKSEQQSLGEDTMSNDAHAVNLLWHCEDGSVEGGPSSYRIRCPVTIQNRLQCQIECRFMHKQYDATELYRVEELPSCVLEAGTDADLVYSSTVLMQLLVDKFEVSLDTVIDESHQVLVTDASGQTLNIEMDSDVTEDGRTVVTLYASTWIVNYTRLPLRYWRPSQNGLSAMPGVPREGIISQSPTLCDAETIQVSVVGESNMFALHPDDTALSKPFNLTSVGTTGVVSIEDLPRTDDIPQHRYDLVVANRLGKGRYRRTRVVAISAQYQLLNHLAHPVFYIQADAQALRAAEGGLAVPPGVSTPIYFRNTHGHAFLYLRAGSASHIRWSSGVALDSACNLALAIPAGSDDTLTESDSPEALVRLDCQVPGASGSQVLLVRPFERERTGYLVENHSSCGLVLWQHGLQIQTGHRFRTLRVEPHQAEPFVWEQPLMQHVVKLELSGCSPTSAAEDGEAQTPLQFQMLASFDDFVERDSVFWSQANLHVLVRVRVRGSTKVLRISTLAGLQRTPTAVDPVAPPTRPNLQQDVAQESVITKVDGSQPGQLPRHQSSFNRRSRPVFVSFELVLPFVQVAIIDRSPGPREIFALCLSDLKMHGDAQLGTELNLDASISACQIEDSSPGVRFPVVFGAANTVSATPFIQLSLIKSLEDSSSHSYPFFSVLIQAASFTLEDTFLSKAVRFFSSDEAIHFGERRPGADLQNSRHSPNKASSFEEADCQVSIWNADGSMDKFSTDATEPHDVKPMYCKVLQLHPIQISVTFVTTGVDFKGTSVIVPFLGDVEDACLRLDALVLENTHTTPPRLAQAVAARYRQQLTYAFYKMIGTADLLGNPIGLIDSLATGVFALFYEPAAAVFKHPTDITIEDLAGGLAKGMGALLHNSIHAPMNSVSKVTGSVSKSMAMLSGDEEYLRSRSRSRRRANMRSGHLGHGLRAGAEGLAKGIGMGLGGLVTAPAKAMRKEGIWGLGAGFAKGLTGAVVKPTVGAIDMAEGVTTGIRNTATIINAAAGRGPSKRRRLRAPRDPTDVNDEHAALTEYDAALARGFSVLCNNEHVVAYLRRGEGSVHATGDATTGTGVGYESGVVMLTNIRLLVLDDVEGLLSADGPIVEVELASINSVAKNAPSETGEHGILVRTKPLAVGWKDQWRAANSATKVVEDEPQGATILIVLNEPDVDEFTALVSMQMAKMGR